MGPRRGTGQSHHLQGEFAEGLKDGGLRSWVGDKDADTKWVAPRLGDFYPHETLISHIRRLLTHEFLHRGLGETRAHFRRRLDLVENHLNSDQFGGTPGALLRLAKSYRERAQMLVDRSGDRLPK